MTQPQQPSQKAAAFGPVIYGGQALRQAQDAALAPILTRVRQVFHLHGVPVTQGQRDAMVPYLWRPMKNARVNNYTAAAQYLRGQGILQVPPMRPYEQQALDKMLADTVDRTVIAGDPVTENNRTSPVVVEQTRKSVARAVSRHAQQPARETVKEVADGSGEEIGWARMLTGARSCAFCAMLASRGPVYKSDKTALYRGGASAGTYHEGCDCIAVLVRKGIPWEGETSHQMLDQLWQDTGGQTSGKRALNAFRRTWDKSVRDGGTGDYIADSMKPPGGA